MSQENLKMSIRDVKSLAEAIAAGRQAKYVFFWGHQPRTDGAIDKACFSQWWPAPFEMEGTRYETAEHWMMAEKARLFGDEETRQAVLEVEHPGAAKKLGRAVRGFDEETWQRQRFEIVIRGNLAKFQQHAELSHFLANTGERVLVEASPVDRVWGIGLAADHADAMNPAKWRGLNLLGFALMEVRERLRSHGEI